MKRSGIQETVRFIIPYQNSSCLQEGQTVHEGRFSKNLVIKLKITCTNSNIICCISCTKHSFVSFCFALYLKGIFLLSNNLNKFWGSDTTYPLGSANLSSEKNAFYPLGKKPYPLGSGILSSGKTAFYPRGKGLGYPLVSGTLSSGKWHIILWERKLIPSGKRTRGN